MSRFQPLTYALAGLLGEPFGSDRAYGINGVMLPPLDDLVPAAPLDGTLVVTRTNRGLLVDSRIRTALAGTCSRCLRDLEIPLDLRIQEEVLPGLDPATGQPVDRSAEPEVARLTDHHELELEPLVREAISLAEPIAPLCEPGCPGLCIGCGERLGSGHAEHPEDDIDPRLEALRGFRVDAEAENR
ncbi:MAG: DUF177 domain-containing protein [Candidatus Limnocylindrales bacterium]